MKRSRKTRGKSDRRTVRIRGIHDAYGVFLNESAYGVRLDGVTWPTVTHYLLGQQYPAAVPFGLREAPSVDAARALARRHGAPERNKWEVVRDDYLYRALSAKFSQHLDLEEHLLRTGYARIVYESDVDGYYGTGPGGTGHNMFGRLLVRVRRRVAADQDRRLKTSDQEHAIKWLTILVKAEPENAANLAALADEYLKQGLFVDALAFSHRVVAHEPESEWGHSIMAQALMALRRYEEAVRPLKALIRIDPGDPDYYRWMSDVQARLDRWIAAQLYERRARLLEESDDD
jgi:hypothetical protein